MLSRKMILVKPKFSLLIDDSKFHAVSDAECERISNFVRNQIRTRAECGLLLGGFLTV